MCLLEVEETDWDYVIRNMKLNSVSYKITVDKATYYPLKIDIEMDMEINDVGSNQEWSNL